MARVILTVAPMPQPHTQVGPCVQPVATINDALVTTDALESVSAACALGLRVGVVLRGSGGGWV
jgi:hypothetical protein